LGPGALPAERRTAAARALAISGELGWQDHRRAFAHYAAGRQLQGSDPARALGHFRQADAIYARTPATALHRAYVAAQIAANAVSQGDGSAALRALDPHLGAAREAENAALLATLLLLRAEALELEGRAAEARAARLDSLGWARYGFGPDWAVRAKLREVAALNPRTARG
jgi:predicted ATPase